MTIGFDSWKDLLEVLLVPLVLGVFAIAWPAIGEHRKRVNFENLTRRELEEAKPHDPGDKNAPWHAHLRRRFLHEQIVRSPGENAGFVLSLAPELSYHVSQLWIEYEKAREEARSGKPSTGSHAVPVQLAPA